MDTRPGREIVPSVCPHDCPSQCLLEVERLDARTIGRVHGAKANSYTEGVICAKVARYAERVHHPDRLTTPLARTGPKGSGAFAPIGWDEALDRVAEAFIAAARRHGPEAVWPYYYAGTMGFVQRDGIHRLRHAMKYSGQDNTICSRITDTGWSAGVGQVRGVDPREMVESDLIVLWGTNAVATQINVMHHVTKARKARGTKVVVVDPYRNATAEAADIHLCLRPGTDGALACAVMHVLFAEGIADWDYLRRYTDVPDELAHHLKTRTPAWAAAITGLQTEEIVAFARLYGRTPRSYIRLGYGFSRSRNGAANFHAVTCLPAVTGAWRHRGGGALYHNRAIYRLNKTMIEGLDVRDPAVRTLDQSRIGAVLTGDPTDLGAGPPVTAMLVQNTNPMMVAPEHLKVRAGFARDDLFVCVHEQFMTETAAMADIVLPATTFLEHDDFYYGGGHSHLMIGARAIEPYAESRANHDVVCALAARVGARHPGFALSAWELIDWTLKASGWPDAVTVKAARWIDCMPAFETAHFLDGFPTTSGRFRFKPDWRALGTRGAAMPPLPDHHAIIDAADPEHPFRLVTAPARNFLNSSFTETPSSRAREGRPTVLIRPDDAARLGIAEAAPVRLGNRQGSVVVHAKLFAGLQPGVVVVESIWPNGAYVEGVGINALTSAQPAPPAGGAPFHDSAVWVRAG
ncbi:MAG: molybdopterin oxidoreductase family protein [Alphaproteobacteria bacterium]|nr:molybdopterin oxidoreductase family protein [Alphaproteobacteria bacterium]